MEEVEAEAEVLGSGRLGKGSEGQQVSSLPLKEMPLAVYQSRV